MLFIAYAGPPDEDERRLADLVDAVVEDTEDPQAVEMSTNGFFENWVNNKMQQALALQATPALPEYDFHENNRGLQVPFLMDVTFENCLFINNKQGPVATSGVPLLGVMNIIAPFNPTTVVNCTFEGNTFDGSDGSQNGYAIQTLASELTVERTCLIENSFIGFGPVQAFAGAPLTLDNTFTTLDDLVFCEFAAQSDSSVPASVADLVCFNKDRASCRAEEPIIIEDPPTGAPTPTDTNVETPTTSPPTDSGSVSSLQSGSLLLSLSTGLCVYLLAIHL